MFTAGHMGEGDAKAQAYLRVGGKDYHVVAAVLMMLGLIESYLHYQEAVPVFTGEVAHRIVELLKVRSSVSRPHVKFTWLNFCSETIPSWWCRSICQKLECRCLSILCQG